MFLTRRSFRHNGTPISYLRLSWDLTPTDADTPFCLSPPFKSWRITLLLLSFSNLLSVSVKLFYPLQFTIPSSFAAIIFSPPRATITGPDRVLFFKNFSLSNKLKVGKSRGSVFKTRLFKQFSLPWIWELSASKKKKWKTYTVLTFFQTRAFHSTLNNWNIFWFFMFPVPRCKVQKKKRKTN